MSEKNFFEPVIGHFVADSELSLVEVETELLFIIFVRNDLFITIVRGTFDRGKPGTSKNIEVS